MKDSTIFMVLLLLVVTTLAEKASPLHCPFANPMQSHNEPTSATKTKRNSGPFDDSYLGAPGNEHSIDALLKTLLPKYSISSGPQSSQESYLNLDNEKHSAPIKCGIPPFRCLNNTQNLHYRSIDGACNNLVYPEYGIAPSRYARLLPPRYADNIYAPGVANSGAPLPNARLISLSVYGEETKLDYYRTMAAMQWGQLVAHDISQLTTKGAPSDCCTEHRHKLCYPIPLPSGGPIAYNTGKSCLSFARSISDADAVCPKSGYPYSEKISVATAYLDLSSLYGNSLEQSRRVRSFEQGLLRSSYLHNQNWLPITQNLDNECGTNQECYSLPDKRNRLTPTIVVLHTLMHREHNRLARQLALLNPHYTDERLYQEARKINIAQFQKITYYDWLPLFVGHDYAHLSGLIYPEEPAEYANDYDESVNPAPYAEFSMAAFRYSHNQIPGWFSLVAPNRYANQTLRLSDYFERQDTMHMMTAGDNYDALLRGLATQLQKRADANIDREIRHYFNRKDFEEYGSDLKSVDIQRGRDFGLASYNDMREYCGLSRAIDWSDFSNEISHEKIELLRKVYASPDDVDLTIGGSLEYHTPEGLFGPTFLCIVGKQFLNLRRGDRFFFERVNHISGFSVDQLAEIRKASVASLFCNNAQYLRHIQRNVFIFPSAGNELSSCNDIQQMDLSKWQDIKTGYLH